MCISRFKNCSENVSVDLIHLLSCGGARYLPSLIALFILL